MCISLLYNHIVSIQAVNTDFVASFERFSLRLILVVNGVRLRYPSFRLKTYFLSTFRALAITCDFMSEAVFSHFLLLLAKNTFVGTSFERSLL